METLEADLKCLRSRVSSLEENIQEEAELLEQLNNFLQVALPHTPTHTHTGSGAPVAEAA